MKIGILTLPLTNNNYGGILQAYALLTFLKQMGHDAVFIDRYYPSSSFNTLLKCHVGSIIHGRGIYKKNSVAQKQIDYNAQELIRFRSKYIQPSTMPIRSNFDLQKLSKMGFDAFIVGSDQVWRGLYIPGLEDTYFLSFVNNKWVKKIAFAASFGKDCLDLNIAKNAKKYAKYLQQFDAISVRENSGITICKEKFNVDAIQLIDPTLLLNASEYVSLIEKECEVGSTGKLCSFFLDSSELKKLILKTFADRTNLEPYILNKNQIINEDQKIENSTESVLYSVTHWLKSINEAEYVITDSFHGCVFSIILKKKFIVVGNQERGIDRFTSLLALFNLSDRLVSTEKEALDKLLKPIDYIPITAEIDKYRNEAKLFLKKALND